MEALDKALMLLLGLFGPFSGTNDPPRPPAPRPAEVRPADPVPCVKPWLYSETKAQHEAKPCPVTAPEPAGIEQP